MGQAAGPASLHTRRHHRAAQPGHTFVFREGFALDWRRLAAARAIGNGETFNVNGTTFEFRKSGAPSAATSPVVDQRLP